MDESLYGKFKVHSLFGTRIFMLVCYCGGITCLTLAPGYGLTITSGARLDAGRSPRSLSICGSAINSQTGLEGGWGENKKDIILWNKRQCLSGCLISLGQVLGIAAVLHRVYLIKIKYN